MNGQTIQAVETNVKSNGCPGCGRGWTVYLRPAGFGIYATGQAVAMVYLCHRCTQMSKTGNAKQQRELDQKVNAFLAKAQKLETTIESRAI